MKMVSVLQADHLIGECRRDYGSVPTPLEQSFGRILAEDISADRDLPPYHRVAMDGIALRYSEFESGCRRFALHAVVAAGDPPPGPLPPLHCFEIMTGAALPEDTDTVIPVEQLLIENGYALIQSEKCAKGQHIHVRGSDKGAGELLITQGAVLGPAEISTAASVGKHWIRVANLPRVAVFSSGKELVDVQSPPLPHQIRRSNTYAVQSLLHPLGIKAESLHLDDDPQAIRALLSHALASFDVLLLSGGISMGKFDFIPQILSELGLQTHFYKVKQRPGKPFWFGSLGDGPVVFALPGNPVSTFLCALRYVLPWLRQCLGQTSVQVPQAVLDRDLTFGPDLQWFLPVRLRQGHGAVWTATPVPLNGSGDFQALLDADAFLELPEAQNHFQAGEAFPVWSWK